MLVTGLAGGLFIAAGGTAKAAWDPPHAAAAEDLLNRFTRSLPNGARITPPRVIIYQGTAYSRACPDSGIKAPSYCPGDNTIYLETSLGDAVDARYGDFGALSILAHEFGHALMSQLQSHPTGKQGELAADRFAGAFARYSESKGVLEPGDLNEARLTFAAVGDHNIYSHDHHGTPAERKAAFDDGYVHGFRIPTDASNGDPITPQQPQTPPTAPSAQPPVPTTERSADAAPAGALLGLGLGIAATIALGAAMIALIRRATSEDDL